MIARAVARACALASFGASLAVAGPARAADAPQPASSERPATDARAPADPPVTVPLVPPAAPHEPPPRDPRGAAGLRADVRRIVDAEDSSGWFVDETHLVAMTPALLQSICRATPEARAEAAAGLADERARAGDARTLFVAAGNRWTAQSKEAMRLEREARALEHGRTAAATSCPFWVTPQRGYDGRQTDRNRFTLNLETGGLLQVRRTEQTYTYGGGGVIRLLGGYGFAGKTTLLAGAEFAGGAMIRPGVTPSSFVVNYFPALPVVLRFHDVSWHYDLEIAGVSLFQADDPRFSYGGRLGFSLGVSALRTRFVIPWAGAVVAYEHYFESGGRAPADFVRAGLRVGAVFDPF